MLNKKVLEILENHKSIRKFEQKDIEKEIKEALIDSFLLSPTAQGLQSCSIIEVNNKEIKKELAKLSGQTYLEDVPLMYLFIVDMYKNINLKDENIENLGINHLLQGYVDSVISAQSLYLTAESNGLGGFYCASMLKEAEKIIEIFNLPKYTYPVIGLCLGYPAESPMKKPRLDKEYRFFVDGYIKYDNYEKEFENYNEVFSKYIDTRNPNNTVGKFTDVVKKAFNVSKLDTKVLKKQGFDL